MILDENRERAVGNYDAAVSLAEMAHAGQVYHPPGGDVPFIQHCLWVARLLDDPTDKIVAVLHDILEDTDTTAEKIEQDFGTEVCRCVLILTHSKNETYFDYIKRCSIDERARRVKIADRSVNLHNCDGHTDARYHGLAKRYTKALDMLGSQAITR
jgi:(p)ppGpp synthase/HD superfamily hydrolase